MPRVCSYRTSSPRGSEGECVGQYPGNGGYGREAEFLGVLKFVDSGANLVQLACVDIGGGGGGDLGCW